MVKPEWGAKHGCPKCGTRFYDLGKDDPVTCIECGHAWQPDAVLKKPASFAPRSPLSRHASGLGLDRGCNPTVTRGKTPMHRTPAQPACVTVTVKPGNAPLAGVGTEVGPFPRWALSWNTV